MRELNLTIENGSIDFIPTKQEGLEINSYTHGKDNSYVLLNKSEIIRLRDYLNTLIKPELDYNQKQIIAGNWFIKGCTELKKWCINNDVRYLAGDSTGYYYRNNGRLDWDRTVPNHWVEIKDINQFDQLMK